MSHPLILFDWQTYRDYFANLAAEHVQVKYFGAGDMSRMLNDVKSAASLPLMWLAGPEDPVRVIDNRSDNPMGLQRGKLLVLGQAASEKYSEEDGTYKDMEQIVRDVMARMRKDYQEGKISMLTGTMMYGRTEDVPGAVRMVGCALDFEIMTPLRLTYNEEIWVEEEDDEEPAPLPDPDLPEDPEDPD